MAACDVHGGLVCTVPTMEAGPLAKVREQFPVELVDIDKAPETRRPRVIEGQRVEAISRVPTFWLIKRGQKKPTRVWVGGRTLQQIQQVVDSLED